MTPRLVVFVLSAFVLQVDIPGVWAAEGKGEGASASRPATKDDELSQMLEMSKEALKALQPLKASLSAKLDQYKADHRAAPSESLTALIERHEAQLQKIRIQEREIRQTMATLEALIAERKRDATRNPKAEQPR